MKNGVIETQTTKMWISEKGIVRVDYKTGVAETISEAKDNFNALKKLSAGKRFSVLVDIRKVKSQDRKSRQLFAGKKSDKIMIATGLIIGSPLSRVIGNFFLGLNKPQRPVKLFTSENEAIEWLKQFLEE